MTSRNLDEKVNENETLLDYIQNSFKCFYDDDITRDELEAMTDEEFNMLVEELDYLWSK